ncbi:MAG: 2-amino-4-hydroxy-6-hydroxymethyldihydropteridine diphosphokinase [Spirochaetes bacterium]|nr:2-amino-4-hydroxy-6-hydroxymethyldihydropteridine diphosphokinase [Spirochaetota bacterium]
MKEFYYVTLSLGSNTNNAKHYLNLAFKALQSYFEIVDNTGILKSEPFGYKDQNDFYNALLIIKTKYLPGKLLKILQNIERKLNKNKNKNIFWGERIIDIDIIKFEDFNIFSNNLTIPHPGLRDRKYLKILMEKLNKIELLKS